ncbi:MAG TPA: beta-ketoacyl synthase N-terminal-like domain-containing protein [Pseudonocardiaceae bacterium]
MRDFELIRPLPELLAAHAARNGAKIAFEDSRRAVSYARLDARTGRLAGHLAALLRPGDRAAIFLGNRVETVESYLAIARAAAVGVPLNPQSADAELAYLLEDSGARVIITDEPRLAAVRRQLPGHPQLTVLVTDDVAGPDVVSFERLAETEPALPARDDLGLDDAAWMLYTSGTTGRPKGVLSTQRSCLWSVAASAVGVLGLAEPDRVLWPVPMFHSLAHIYCVLGVTTVGASARITEAFDADEVLSTLRGGDFTFLVGVPTMYHYLLDATRGDVLPLPGLRVCLAAGAVSSAALRASFEATFGVALLDCYGSTETCGLITANRPGGALVEGSCGEVVPGLAIRVADPGTGAEVATGDEGEIWVGGPSLMLGYHGRPAATAAALRDGWYRTGDLGRRDGSGAHTITGRLSEVIIRSGENIHPAEVEHVLLAVPGVRDAAVTGIPHPTLGEVPLAFVVPDEQGVDADALFAACREQLAYFKVPDALYQIGAVPRTASGKITRHALTPSAGRLRGTGHRNTLLGTEWTPLPPVEGGAGPDVVLRWPCGDIESVLSEQDSSATVLVVTRGAVPGRDPIDLANATAWGLVESIQADRPGLLLLDADTDDITAALPSIVASGEPRLALRDGILLAPRLIRATSHARLTVDRSDRTVLVTGADTATAAELATHLVAAHGVRHLLLTGTRGSAAAELAATLTERGADVITAACDPADRESLAAVLASVRRPIGAVVHVASGSAAAANLHELTADLSAFVLVAPGASGPEAGFLRGLAQLRRDNGLPATAIAVERDADRLAAFDLADTVNESFVLAARLDQPTSAAAVVDLSGAGRERALLELVLAEVAALTGNRLLQARQPFRDIGLTSVLAVDLRNRLAAATGLRLPATLAFDYPNATAVASFLNAQCAPVTHAEAVALPRQADEPIAIVGMGCRYAGGVRSPDDLWRLVVEGRETLSAFPADRGWELADLFDADPDLAGKSYVDRASFLPDATEFDAGFFEISPREALAMDPQQRLLLELAWETVEHAGIDPVSLRGTETGVFAGCNNAEYALLLDNTDDDVATHRVTGIANSVVTGRIAYTLGLAGPAVTVDTACSSSLVALHLASQSLRDGDCALALAGGVTLLVSPGVFIDFSRQRGLAPDGRIKAFAEAADGTAWGEGAGLLLLERLSDARRNNHQVHAVIRGTAINQDGASNGLTAPNGPAQQRVIQRALSRAGLRPSDVDAVEAHGTGTRLGDPIEANALLATYGADRPADRPLWLGSIKPNIGHTQAAAGVAGVIKMVQAIRHGTLPATLNVAAPSSHVDWTNGGVELLTEQIDWPVTDHPRRAGISSFGISGTNAHAIIEAALPPSWPPVDGTAGPQPFVLSARDDTALRASAAQLLQHLRTHPAPQTGLARALATTRAAHEHRAAIVAASLADLEADLDTLAKGAPSAHVESGTARDPGKLVFVFPGQGSQWPGMATDLLADSPLFRARFGDCADALAPHVDFAPFEALADPDLLARVEVVQPLLWAVHVCLAHLWQHAGVRPDAVVGHSQGEIAAATVAGAFSLNDAARLIAVRSRSIIALGGAGGMAAIPLAARDIALPGGVTIAAVNGPAATIVSGDVEPLRALVEDYRARDIRARLVPVNYASHSAHVEPLREQILDALSFLRPGPVEVPMYSTVTGQVLTGAELTGDYWYANYRETVQFQPAVEALLGAGHRTFVETSAHPVLVPAIADTAADAITVGTLHRDDGGHARWYTALTEAWVHGLPVDFGAVLPAAEPVDLPTYPFQRTRYWVTTRARAAAAPTRTAEPETAQPALAEVLAPMPAATRTRHLVGVVRAEAAAVLGHDSADAVPELRSLQELGFDSVSALKLRNRLGALAGLSLPTTLVFDQPTAAAIASFLTERLFTEPLAQGVQADSVFADRLAEAGGDDLFDLIDNELGTI